MFREEKQTCFQKIFRVAKKPWRSSYTLSGACMLQKECRAETPSLVVALVVAMVVALVALVVALVALVVALVVAQAARDH